MWHIIKPIVVVMCWIGSLIVYLLLNLILIIIFFNIIEYSDYFSSAEFLREKYKDKHPIETLKRYWYKGIF